MRSLQTPANRVAFGKRLVAAREERGMTQQTVADSLGIPRTILSRMETGERRVDALEIADFMRLYRKGYRYFVPGV